MFRFWISLMLFNIASNMLLNSPFLVSKVGNESTQQRLSRARIQPYEIIRANSCLSSLPYAIVYKQSERNYRRLSTLANTNAHEHSFTLYTHTGHICAFVCLSRFNYRLLHSINMMVSDCYFVWKPIDAKTVYWLYLFSVWSSIEDH